MPPRSVSLRPVAASAAVAAFAVLAACARRPATPPVPQARASAGPAADTSPAHGGAPAMGPGPAMAGAGGAAGEPNPRPYRQVITADARTRSGLFTTHRVKSKLLFEIPTKELNRDMLVVSRTAKTILGAGYGGQEVANRVVRWERRDSRVLLRAVSYETVADTSTPVYQAVQASNFSPIVAAFNVEAFGPDSAPVIDVTRLYTGSVPEFGPGLRVRGAADPSRSFIERVAAYPENIEVEATQTIAPPPVAPPGPTPVPGIPPELLASNQNPTSSLLMHFSMVRLPDHPMAPRLFDSRVGYFSVRQLDYGRPEARAVTRRYIVRWRLEKRDTAAAVSDPIKPITYYIDPATPKAYIPWIKKGIEDWQPAFEAAGFRRGIVAKDAPTSTDDPDWAPEDVRYSVIRWLPSTIENAQGPNVHDPRTGEVLNADIYFYHNVMNLARDWYFVQAGAVDPRVRSLPFPDSLMGRLVEYVVAHEVGHTLGFQHNMKSSATYPADSVRSASFVHRWGHTPSLMDYSRFNYVAQPEDSVALEDLVPRVGAYDVWATRWGYAPIPGATTPDAEKPTLDAWAREQDTKPWLRFSTAGADGSDPGDNTEAVGDADAIASTALGIRNLKRIVPLLMPATARVGEDYTDLSELYGRLVGQWAVELGHVVQIVGGAESQEKHVGQEGVRFTPLPRARQQAAIRFLNANAFQTPSFLLDETILRRIEVGGAMERLGRVQQHLLDRLLDDDRLDRMTEFEAAAKSPSAAYTIADMLSDIRRGVWSELGAGAARIDPYRRNVQRIFLQAMNVKLNPPELRPPRVTFGQDGTVRVLPARLPGDAPAVIRGELRALDAMVAAAIPKATDRETRFHLESSRADIARILDPRVVTAHGVPLGGTVGSTSRADPHP